MGHIARLSAFLRVMRRKKRPLDAMRLLRQRPALLLAAKSFETALMASGLASARLKALARVKTITDLLGLSAQGAARFGTSAVPPRRYP